MNKKLKRLLIIALFLFLLGAIAGGGYWYYAFVYCENNRTIPADKKPDITLNADELIKQVEADWEKAGKTGKIPSFIDEDGPKIIQTTGIISSVTNMETGNSTIVLLDELIGINCSFDSSMVVLQKNLFDILKAGDNITIKGKITGFDFDEDAFELLGEENKKVKLSECTLIK